MSEEQNEAQPEEAAAEPQRVPLTQALSYGAGTFAVAGLIDGLAHFGLTGLVVGGILAYAASQHGPELVEQVREALPPPAPARPASRQPGKSKRSVLDRALERFTCEEQKEIARESDDMVIVDESDPWQPAAPGRSFRPSVISQIVRHPIRLAPDLVLEGNDIVGAGINIFGIKGSGKTGALVRLAEQFARYRVSQVLFDIKGDLGSLVTDRRPDGRPFVPDGFMGYRGHAPRGRSVLQRGMQVVYDLRTWQTPEQMACLICVIGEELLETVALTPEGELAPCLVFLDEAEYWLPQSQPSYLSQRTYTRLRDTFHTLATMGRSRGLAPVIATQRIAKVNKDIIAQAEMTILMKAELDIDLDRYSDYFHKSLASRERIRGFAAGEAVVCLPNGKQLVTRFSQRESRHSSHTPRITAGLRKFSGRERGPVELDNESVASASAQAAGVPSADQSFRRITTPPQATLPDPFEDVPPPGPHLSEREQQYHRVLDAWCKGIRSIRSMMEPLGLNFNQTRELLEEMDELGLIPWRKKGEQANE